MKIFFVTNVKAAKKLCQKLCNLENRTLQKTRYKRWASLKMYTIVKDVKKHCQFLSI